MPRTTISTETPAPDACTVSLSMMPGSISEFIFIQIAAGRPALAWADLGVDVINDTLAQIDGRRRHRFQFGKFGIAGDEVEDPSGITRDHRIVGVAGQVGIDARGDWMIIAGCNMHVGREFAGFTPQRPATACRAFSIR